MRKLTSDPGINQSGTEWAFTAISLHSGSSRQLKDQRECDSQERKVDAISVPYLGGLCVGGLLGGHVLLPGEPDAEHPQGVAVRSLDINVALDQRLPLLDHGPQLIRGQAHPVEVGQAVLALE